jgi:hypothetical protein
MVRAFEAGVGGGICVHKPESQESLNLWKRRAQADEI